MRRALGLLPGGRAAPARNSGRGHDASGPVVEHRGGRSGQGVNRVAVAEAALADERHAREHATRLLREAEAALHEAETKRGHAELARDEALAALDAERQARQALEARLAELEPAAEPPADPPEALLPRRRGRPPKVAAPAPEQDAGEPVEWWLPGWRR